MNRVSDIRSKFVELKRDACYVTDKTGCDMLELVGESFLADEPAIFGNVNDDYVKRELEWYRSQSRYVKDIPGGPPREWLRCADSDGMINSNYGWMIWSEENGLQYKNARDELLMNPSSRRAVMIYTRPSMWTDYNAGGMSDFVCTNAVQYMIRGGALTAVVQMRSADVIFGYRNDYAWQRYVQSLLASDLGVKTGDIIWHAGSLHIYSRHFYLVDHYIKTNEISITKSQYDAIYGDGNDKA